MKKLLLFALLFTLSPAAHAGLAEAVKASGVTGGIIVHLGCGDGKDTAELLVGEQYLVHGLDEEADNILKAREYLQKQGCYGKVSVRPFNGEGLPYVDNLINLVVISGKDCKVPGEEIKRVLVPGGVVIAPAGSKLQVPGLKGETSGKWTRIVKPVPEALDEWTHFLHSADNNAVANDSHVGMPRAFQWVVEPRWGRSHEEFASMSAAVTAGGRIFYIVDEAPLASIRFMSEWKLVARDAYNGSLLWKRDIPRWNDHLRHFRSGPVHLPQRLMAVGDRVYVTLGLAAPVSALDAVTGKTLKTYKGTERTEEIRMDKGILYLIVGASEKVRRGGGLSGRNEPEPTETREIMAVNAETGKQLWKKDFSGENFILPLGLAVKGDRVYCQSTSGLHALDAGSGKELWKAERKAVMKRMGFLAPTLVATDEVILSADRNPDASTKSETLEWGVHGWNESGFVRKAGSTLNAYAATDGKLLWSAPCNEKYNSTVDVFVIDGLVRMSHDYAGRDLKTGEVKETINVTGDRVGMPHHRCYRNKASSDFIFLGRSGIEVLDLERGWIGNNSWVRGTCQYGIMPANGLLYAPPDACGCFLSVKEPGFIAIGPRREIPDIMRRVEKGPAFGRKRKMGTAISPTSWPMYRRDAMRSAINDSMLPDKVSKRWSRKIGGRLTQSVICYGLVYVAAIDAHTLHAFSAKHGKPQWSYTAGGRIDSAPTVHGNMVFFGSADGWVTCLDALTGELAWRTLVAPAERLACAYGQLESVWPVHGAVVVQNGAVYAAAGRSSYMDGGIRIVRLDRDSGKELSCTPLYHIDDSIDRQRVAESGFNMEGTTRDILCGDGDLVYLKYFAFDKNGQRTKEGLKPHLFSITSILGEDWFVRSYWTISDKIEGAGWGGWANTHNRHPSGRILAYNDDLVYGYGRVKAAGGATGHKAEAMHLFCRDRKPPAAPKPAPKPPQQKGKRKRRPPPVPVKLLWSNTDALIVRALAVGNGRMAVAGPRNIAKKAEGSFAFSNDAEARDAYRGDKGAVLQVISTADGTTVCEAELGGMPVHDGLSIAGKSIFVSLRDGSVECWGE